MRKHLVLVGGGHAHMMVLENIRKFVEKQVKVTVIGPSDYHYYSGMGPGMLGRTYTPDEIRFATQKVVQSQGGVFIKDRVVKVDPEQRIVYTLSGNTFGYDLLSFNAGSYVPLDTIEDQELSPNIYSVKPIERLMEAADKLSVLFKEKQSHVAVVGGGASSAEVAGNVWQLAMKTGGYIPEITILSGKRFMARFPDSVRKRIKRLLTQKGIKIDESGYVKSVQHAQITLENGKTLSCDFIFMALGVKPSTIFKESGLPVGADNGLLVNQYLQSTQYPEIFGGGDCICFDAQPLDKVGVYAVRQNPILLHNLMASVENRPLQVFDPGPDYLLIFNVGGHQGVLKKHGIVFSGRLAFRIKDYIDRRFMKKFQAIEKSL